MLLFRALVIFAVLSLSACGFTPLYATHNALNEESTVQKPDIEISNIPDEEGQYLRNFLIDRLYTHGYPSNAPYELTFSPLAKEVVNLGIQKDATATRAQMQIATMMQLKERSTGKIVLQRKLRTVGAYNLLDNQLATLVSQQNITEGILQEMGDEVVMELNLYFHRKTT